MNIGHKLTLVLATLIFSIQDARADSLQGLSGLTEFFIPMVIWFVLSILIAIIFSLLWRSQHKKIYSYFTYAGLISLVLLFIRLAIGFFNKYHPPQRYGNRTLIEIIRILKDSDYEHNKVVFRFLILAIITILITFRAYKKMK